MLPHFEVNICVIPTVLCYSTLQARSMRRQFCYFLLESAPRVSHYSLRKLLIKVSKWKLPYMIWTIVSIVLGIIVLIVLLRLLFGVI